MSGDLAARIARDYGVAADRVPPVRVIPQGVSGERELTRREAMDAGWRILGRRMRMIALQRREARARGDA